jgi:hypothetical protein
MKKDLLWRRLKMKYTLISQPDPNLTVVEQILVNRGIDLKNVARYLRTTDAELNNSLLLKEIDKAVALFVKHLALGSKIYLQVDSQ